MKRKVEEVEDLRLQFGRSYTKIMDLFEEAGICDVPGEVPYLDQLLTKAYWKNQPGPMRTYIQKWRASMKNHYEKSQRPPCRSSQP